MALKSRVQVLSSPPADPPRPAPPDPQAETKPLPLEENTPAAPAVPAPPAEEPKDVAKKKSKKAAKPKAQKPKAPEAPAPASTPRKKKKRVINWNETPFAVISFSSGRVTTACKTKEEALAVVQGFSLSRQRHSFIGEFRPVKVEVKTHVVLE